MHISHLTIIVKVFSLTVEVKCTINVRFNFKLERMQHVLFRNKSKVLLFIDHNKNPLLYIVNCKLRHFYPFILQITNYPVKILPWNDFYLQTWVVMLEIFCQSHFDFNVTTV